MPRTAVFALLTTVLFALMTIAIARPEGPSEADRRYMPLFVEAQPDVEDDSSRRVTVLAGDNLWSISASALETRLGRKPTPAEVTTYWHRVIDFNARGLRSKDPDLIFPGELIELP